MAAPTDPHADYAERMAAVRAELRTLLAPRTEQEYRVMEWLADWDLPILEPLRDMVRRAKRDAWDEGYRAGEGHGFRSHTTYGLTKPLNPYPEPED
jgi:hypothetical protein